MENGRLFAQLTEQPRHEIFPQSADQFFWKVTNAHVAFLRDEKGAVTAAQHTQNGATFRAAKLGDPDVKLSAAQLDALVGDYEYGPGSVLTVSREGEQLTARLTGQPGYPIFPKSETEFVWRIVPARVEFTKGADGKVTKATHHQGGRSFDAPKIR